MGRKFSFFFRRCRYFIRFFERRFVRFAFIVRDFAVHHVDAAVALLRKGLIVGHNDKSLSQIATELEKEFLEFGAVFGVERTSGFIGKNDVGFVHQSPRSCHTLFFTAGERSRFVRSAVSESHIVEEFFGSLLGRTLGSAGNEGRHHDIFECGELRQELMKLKDEADVGISEMGERGRGESRHVGVCNAQSTFVGTIERAHNL